jgi:hypothetical protein
MLVLDTLVNLRYTHYCFQLDKERSVDPADIMELMKAAQERDRHASHEQPFDEYADNPVALQVRLYKLGQFLIRY